MLLIGWGVWDGVGIVVDVVGIVNVEEMWWCGFCGFD